MIYEKILELSNDNKVELSKSFKDFINSKLALGMTRYVVRHGSLSDGHEKITPALKYFQAIKEMWILSGSIEETKANSIEAQADLIESEEELKTADTESKKLRATAKKMRAERKLINCLVSVQDALRQLDEFNKVRLETKDIVEAKYPEGIEQAEEDNWKAVFEYRALKGDQKVQNIPLAPQVKAKLGVKYGNMEAIAPLAFEDRFAFNRLIENFADEQKKLLENK